VDDARPPPATCQEETGGGPPRQKGGTAHPSANLPPGPLRRKRHVVFGSGSVSRFKAVPRHGRRQGPFAKSRPTLNSASAAAGMYSAATGKQLRVRGSLRARGASPEGDKTGVPPRLRFSGARGEARRARFQAGQETKHHGRPGASPTQRGAGHSLVKRHLGQFSPGVRLLRMYQRRRTSRRHGFGPPSARADVRPRPCHFRAETAREQRGALPGSSAAGITRVGGYGRQDRRRTGTPAPSSGLEDRHRRHRRRSGPQGYVTKGAAGRRGPCPGGRWSVCTRFFWSGRRRGHGRLGASKAVICGSRSYRARPHGRCRR